MRKSVFFWFTPMFRLLGLGVLLLATLSACSLPGSTSPVPMVPTAIGSGAYMSPSIHVLKGVQQGMVTIFTLPGQTEIKNLVDIQADIWFGEYTTNRIGKINDQGQLSEYTLPTVNSQPGWGTAGLAGNFWFSEEGANRVAQISSKGDVTEYTLPTPHAKPGQLLLWGNVVWFTETGTHKLGRIDQSNQIVEFPLNSAPDQLATAGTEEKNGNLWFTEPTAHKLGHITFDGQISEFTLPDSITHLDSIAGDGNGNLWFATGQALNNQLGYVTPDGHFALFSTGRQNIVKQLIQDGDAIDFIEQNNNTFWTINQQGIIQARFAAPSNLMLPTPLMTNPQNGKYWYAKTDGSQSQLWELNISPYGP